MGARLHTWSRLMKGIIPLTLIALFFINASHAQSNIDIALKQGSKEEEQTKAQLQRLLKTYDVAKWVFTRSVLIDEKAIPHSHPVLTLSTRHLRDDELLLSTFVHEQIHWFLTQNYKVTEADEESTYLHLIVIYLEYRADRELLGELKARQVMEFWAADHYTWIYKTVLERPRDIGNIVFKHKLVPAGRV
jgi:hypothetical protein